MGKVDEELETGPEVGSRSADSSDRSAAVSVMFAVRVAVVNSKPGRQLLQGKVARCVEPELLPVL